LPHLPVESEVLKLLVLGDNPQQPREFVVATGGLDLAMFGVLQVADV
jgi:hypothetical protein